MFRLLCLLSILGISACAASAPSLEGCRNLLRGAGSDLLMETECRL